ncbi:hypothetical protein D0Z07_3339 [Hyphodiscus hymeniophilus]|uniref:Uncharacterized protein n=1 Tax=Hyphodiscus hymeniophilus TaxID=353542 RepID=A0A9P6VLD0_9HELO|nr:hypothetical protein D0Z07_3339 [Hyphodiscus hymeniophilus]
MGSPINEYGMRDRDNESDKAYEAEIENIPRPVAARQAGFGGKAKRHCARWWWVHLIVFCLGFLIISLCLVYVAMPHIANHGVKESHLELTELQFLNPTPDTVVLTQKAILHSPSIYTPTLDPFNATLWLVTNGTFATAPLNILTMPRIHALHPKSNASVVNQEVALLSQDQIAEYATQVLSNKNVSTALTGKTNLHEGHLPTLKINYNTTLTYAGLNGLAGFNVTGAKVNFTAATGTPNMKGFAYIPNPSVITVALGNVTLSLATAKTGILGNATIQDMTVSPGNNTLPLTAFINQTQILSAMDPDSGLVDLIITGTSSVYNGQHIVYYEKALASNVLHLNLNVKQIIADSV